MRKGQIFSVDLLLALAIIVLAIGLTTHAWSQHVEQTGSTVEYSKMQQIAIDAATAQYYNGTVKGIDESAWILGYTIDTDNPALETCIKSARGDNVEVFVCRGE